MWRKPALAFVLIVSLLGFAAGECPAQAISAGDRAGDPLPAGARTRFGTVRWRHGGCSRFLAFLPGEREILSAGDDAVFHVWDYPSGREIRRFGPGTEATWAGGGFFFSGLPVALSPDGKVVASNLDGSRVEFYEVASGKKLMPLKADSFSGTLAFSPDGRLLALRHIDDHLSLWDWASNKELRRSKLADASFWENVPVAFAPDGKLLATIVNEQGANNRGCSTIKFFDPLQGREVGAVKFEYLIASLRFSPDSRLLACTMDEGALRLVNVAAREQFQRIGDDRRDNIVASVFSRDSKTILTLSSFDQDACSWNVYSGRKLRDFGRIGSSSPTFTGDGGSALALSADGRICACAGIDHALHFLDLQSGKEVHAVNGNTASVKAVGYLPDGTRLWTQSDDNQLRHWDRTNGHELKRPAARLSFGAAVGPDGTYAAGPPRAKGGKIVSVATGKTVGTLPPPPFKVRGLPSMTFTPDSTKLAVRWSRDNRIDLYATPAAKLLHSLSFIGPPPRQVRGGPRLPLSAMMLFSHAGDLFAAGSKPGALSIWDTTAGKELTSLALGERLPPGGGAFTPDSRCLALDMNDGTVALWELRSGKARRIFGRVQPSAKRLRGSVFMSPPPPPLNVAFAADGTLLAHAGRDQVIRIWNVVTGKEVATFAGHAGAVNALAFAADGSALVSAGSDTTALLWDVRPARGLAPGRHALSAGELASRWGVLDSEDAAAAFTAVCDLAASPREAVALLAHKLKPAAPVDVKLARARIAELDAAAYKARQTATGELLKLGEGVLPQIDEALAAAPSLEGRRRLEDIKKRLTGFTLTGDKLRLFRAIEILERIGTPEARQILSALARGAPAAFATATSQAALGRLEQ